MFVGTREGWILVSVKGVGGIWVLAYDRSPLVGASICSRSMSQPLRVSFYFYNEPLSRRLAFTSIYINLHDLNTVLLLYLSSLDKDFTLIGLLKQCLQSRGTSGVLKKERYEQRLTHKGVYERG